MRRALRRFDLTAFRLPLRCFSFKGFALEATKCALEEDRDQVMELVEKLYSHLKWPFSSHLEAI